MVPASKRKRVPFGFRDDPSEERSCKLQKWLQEKDNKLYWDITLRGNDKQEVVAHRLDLAVSSDYFAKLFAGDFADSQQSSLDFADISGDVLQQLTLASQHGLAAVLLLVKKQLCEDFAAGVDNPAVHQLLSRLPTADLAEVFSNDKLDVTEATLLTLLAVIAPNRPAADLAQVLALIRYENMSSTDLHTSSSSPLIASNLEVTRQIALAALAMSDPALAASSPKRPRRGPVLVTQFALDKVVAGRRTSPSFRVPGWDREWRVDMWVEPAESLFQLNMCMYAFGTTWGAPVRLACSIVLKHPKSGQRVQREFVRTFHVTHQAEELFMGPLADLAPDGSAPTTNVEVSVFARIATPEEFKPFQFGGP
ncbi:hypothetical protein WJX72_011598 [[Myrmecia] bisecta]|uniref:BTB domain-containing protein n=1 Tax=[Myrmecia] bisecta TaxID=41462 RepID=A0AAW1Q8I7_9CHLO